MRKTERRNRGGVTCDRVEMDIRNTLNKIIRQRDQEWVSAFASIGVDMRLSGEKFSMPRFLRAVVKEMTERDLEVNARELKRAIAQATVASCTVGGKRKGASGEPKG